MTAVEASEYDGSHFGREESTGVILGLSLGQVSFLGVGIVVGIVAIVTLGFPVGLVSAILIGVVFAVIGLPRFGGKSLLRWAWIFVRHWVRSATGQTAFRASHEGAEVWADEEGNLTFGSGDYTAVGGPVKRGEDTQRDKKGRIKPPEGQRLRLPGEFNELQVFQLPGGAAFVYDPRRREAMVVARILTDRAFNLESFERQEDRLRAWAGAQTAIAQIPGVARLQCSDQTTIISGARVLSWYEKKRSEARVVVDGQTGREFRQSGEEIDPFLHASFVDLIDQAEGQPVHEMWLTVVLSQKHLSKRISAEGGRLRGFMEVALSVMGAVESALPESGASVVSWHTPRSLAAVVRTAFDPHSAMEISDRSGERAGVAVEAGGPMFATWTVDQFQSDGAFHRTFKISEWPQAQARLGFLDRLVFAGDFRHTVSLFIRPREARKAFKDVERRKADWETNDTLRRRLGKQPSLRHERQIGDINREETELVQGYAALRIACLVTVSAASEQELEANCADLRTRATEAGCELRLMAGEQESGFIAAATPLGRLLL